MLRVIQATAQLVPGAIHFQTSFVMAPLCLAVFALFAFAAASNDPNARCYDYFNGQLKCGASPNACFVLCGICTQPMLSMAVPQGSSLSCNDITASSDDVIFSAATEAFFNMSALHGYAWLDDPGDVESNASACFKYFLQHMPRRDLVLLMTDTAHFTEFLFDHIRYALLAWRSFPYTKNLPWDLFMDGVLPYSFLTEKRDLWWPWRPRLFQALSAVSRWCMA